MVGDDLRVLTKLVPVELHVATFTDGHGKADTRFVALFGGNLIYLHSEKQDSELRQPASWLTEAIWAKLGADAPEPVIPEEVVDDLPESG